MFLAEDTTVWVRMLSSGTAYWTSLQDSTGSTDSQPMHLLGMSTTCDADGNMCFDNPLHVQAERFTALLRPARPCCHHDGLFSGGHLDCTVHTSCHKPARSLWLWPPASSFKFLTAKGWPVGWDHGITVMDWSCLEPILAALSPELRVLLERCMLLWH